jgi:hypothetical protein
MYWVVCHQALHIIREIAGNTFLLPAATELHLLLHQEG